MGPDFTPFPPLLGGALIGIAASMLLFAHGKVAGISGIYAGLLDPSSRDKSGRLFFVLGLLLSGLLARVVAPSALSAPTVSTGALILAGLLVGYGVRLGNGCTSGHGVCGIARFSGRSLVAVVTFVTTGVLSVIVTKHLLGD